MWARDICKRFAFFSFSFHLGTVAVGTAPILTFTPIFMLIYTIQGSYLHGVCRQSAVHLLLTQIYLQCSNYFRFFLFYFYWHFPYALPERFRFRRRFRLRFQFVRCASLSL
uniref:Uncharacterized protein n=1 Tax=Bactrocera dorsalis TaxID=27457 RepID=A0A034W0H2_BACDO